MAIPNNLPSASTISNNLYSHGQSLSNSATLFCGRSVLTTLDTPTSEHIFNANGAAGGSPVREPSSGNEGHLGKYSDLLFRFVRGNINSFDYPLLHRLRLITFRDILYHIGPIGRVDSLPEELLRQVFTRDYRDFSEIPESQLTQDFCNRAFKFNRLVFECIPPHFKTATMCDEACCRDIKMLRFVPRQIMTQSFLRKQLKNCRWQSFDPNIIPNHLVTAAVIEQLASKPFLSSIYPLALVRPQQREYQHYLQACQQSWRSIESVPEDLKTEEICLAAVQGSYKALSAIPAAKRTPAVCERAFTESVESLQWIPEHLVTPRHRDILIKESVDKLNYLPPVFHYIPEPMRTPKFCQVLLNLVMHYSSFQTLFDFSPTYLHSILPCFIARLKKASISNSQLVPLMRIAFMVEPSPGKRQLIQFIKKMMFFRAADMTLNQNDLFCWLAVKELETAFKLSLLKQINHPDQHLHLLEETAVSLSNLSSPLNVRVQSNTLPELKRVCQRSLLSRMPEHHQGDLLDQFIHDELAGVSVLTDVRPPDFTVQNTFCQGRTLIMPGEHCTRYFKLHRTNEELTQLAKEYLMHRYLGDGKAAELGLKSEIPVAFYLCALPWLAIPEELREQLEPIKLFNENIEADGSTYAIAYCYQTSSTDYASYAWQQDPASPNARCAKAVSGMLRAVHDLGRWCAMGILHTNTMSANQDGNQRWIALESLFQSNREMLCGRLDIAGSKTIERPDFRFSGLAGLVDYERFGCVTSYFTHGCNTNELSFMPKVGQNFCLANYVVEITLANVLLYTRLHKDEHNYHIHSTAAIDDLCAFISLLLTRFSQGLLGEDHPSLAQALCTSSEAFETWLLRTVLEILYWSNNKKRTRNFATDYRKDLRFDRSLYPFPPICIAGAQVKRFPQDFVNHNKQPTIGVENGTFPYMSLIQGLTKFAATLIHTLNQRGARK